VFIEDRHIEVEVIEDKIVIRIQTRHNPESYWGVHEVNIWDGVHSAGLRLFPVHEYVDGNIFVVEVATSHITEWFMGFNLMEVRITGSRKNEVYRYRPSEFIWLIEEPSEKEHIK